MSLFGIRIRPHVEAELHSARQAESRGDAAAAFAHLERAHVLGQASTVQHVRVHGHMLAWALRHRRRRETWGQMLRIVGAATKTVLWVPVGNTGGANVSAFKPMPIADELQRVITAARR
ncbi:DUF3703 domain-containing protein [Rhizobacter sp. J219]|uniref:DUF3703 domain-containing protein n=1 Tax=Rhizobacter sp. J219 TaxID=2898430 RepID=UPI0021512FA6|nr:DUF3703 domain-containing protein [Rhizobacter sp. J219]MCR5883020.1 DUF3703 domain-containing protein [Rhizobacter sp. J219]